MLKAKIATIGFNHTRNSTASFGNPTAIMSIQNELKDLLIAKGFTSLRQAIGYAHRPESE
jgi:dihydroorotate dehydrogenase (NAD+) catalytic subunit